MTDKSTSWPFLCKVCGQAGGFYCRMCQSHFCTANGCANEPEGEKHPCTAAQPVANHV